MFLDERLSVTRDAFSAVVGATLHARLTLYRLSLSCRRRTTGALVRTVCRRHAGLGSVGRCSCGILTGVGPVDVVSGAEEASEGFVDRNRAGRSLVGRFQKPFTLWILDLIAAGSAALVGPFDGSLVPAVGDR